MQISGGLALGKSKKCSEHTTVHPYARISCMVDFVRNGRIGMLIFVLPYHKFVIRSLESDVNDNLKYLTGNLYKEQIVSAVF